MKLSKLAFWRQRRSSKKSKKELRVEEKVSVSDKPEKAELPKRSSSFSGAENSNCENEHASKSKQKQSSKIKRSRSLGNKPSRRSSFIRWFRVSREIGRSLRKIGDDLQSNHSNSIASINSASK